MAVVFAGAGQCYSHGRNIGGRRWTECSQTAPTEFAHITSCEVTGGNQVTIKGAGGRQFLRPGIL